MLNKDFLFFDLYIIQNTIKLVESLVAIAEHVDNLSLFIKNISRLLSDNGIMFLSMITKNIYCYKL
ncbi:hypothetical protein EDL79_02435 [Ehrlichia ruminantium]|uniref:Uncharacterized protein n=1 Tax=Ehrlichia ruminantium TaxID=779 RepID=A0AAE6UII2_EHRRU|nr:hypothetical protein EDL81_02395 [Ehrlichia ruminantium]QGR03417.1 hypothetical protein EDL80_02380 [Ehrlichia ruminantium]QGR04349.1 hypothetical protein EDL79_02435 [Ehrlichia ruminantium]